MGLVERREEILKLLISRRKSTVPILMHEFHVSEKTIRRDIRALMLKYPLETFSGNGGGVQIPEWYAPKDRKSTRLNSSHPSSARMPSSA